MKEEIKKELLSKFGDKGITVISIDKRLLQKAVYDAAGDKALSDMYCYDAEIKFPGHQSFPVTIIEASQVEEKVNEALNNWGIKL